MATKFDTRQSVQRSLLNEIANKSEFSGTTGGKPANSTQLDNLLTAINESLTLPFILDESTTPDLVLNIGSGNVSNSETSKNNTFSLINNTHFEFTSGTITFPSSSGGSIIVSPGTNGVLTVSSGNFITVLIQMNDSGNLSVKTGTEAASKTLAMNSTNFPVADSGILPIGYVVLNNVAGTIQNVTNDNIYQFKNPTFNFITSSTIGVEKLIINSNGGILYDSNGEFVLKS